MIDLKLLRENPEVFIKACQRKKVNFNIEEFLSLDKEYREKKHKVEELRHKKNEVSRDIPKLQGEEREASLQKMRDFARELKVLEQEFKNIEKKWKHQQYLIPSIPLPDVPDGDSDDDNVEVERWGETPKFNFNIKNHAELGEILDIIDIERGVKVSGSRNYFLKGDGARLQHALLSFAIDFLSSKGFTLFDPPHIVKYRAMLGTSYFPGGEEQAYHLDERDKGHYLIGTSEVPVCSYHQDELLLADNLPLLYAGYSPCYRREAGTYGKDTQGIYRVHQFYKVEQVAICRADEEESFRLHNFLLNNSLDILRALKLPYRVVKVCSGEMGLGQVLKHDIEVWMPSRNSYGETHSCSSFYDFQARRLNIKYEDQGERRFCYTLNNTAVASPRILIPLLEIYQNKDGSVSVPEVLQRYMGGQKVIAPR